MIDKLTTIEGIELQWGRAYKSAELACISCHYML